MKKYWNWRDEVSPSVLAWRVPKIEKIGWFKKRKIKDFILSPNDAVVILREGKVEDVLTQTHLKKLGGYLDRGAYYEFLFLTMAPIPMEFILDAVTKDNEKVRAKASALFQFNLANVQKLLPLVESKRTIEKYDIWQLLNKKLGERVIYPIIKQYPVANIKGNVELQRKVQTQAMVELRKNLEFYSLELLDFVMSWDMKEYEALMDRQRRIQRESLERIMREDAIHKEWMALQRRRKEWEIGEVEIEEAKVTTRHEAELERERKQWELEMEQDRAELDLALRAKAQLDELKRKRMELETDLEIKRFQGTELEARKLDVEKERYRLETYKDAENEVRRNQLQMLDVMSKIMQGKEEKENSASEMRICPKCGREIGQDFRLCPYCGRKMK